MNEMHQIQYDVTHLVHMVAVNQLTCHITELNSMLALGLAVI